MNSSGHSYSATAGITLRRETPADRGFLRDLYSETRAAELDAAGLVGPGREAFVEQQFVALCTAYSRMFGDADWWIVERDGVPSGRLIVSRTPEEHRVVDIAIIPEFRGQGLGEHLLRHVQRAAAAEGLPVRLQAFPHGRALALYLRLGFTQVGANEVRVQLEWRQPADSR